MQINIPIYFISTVTILFYLYSKRLILILLI